MAAPGPGAALRLARRPLAGALRASFGGNHTLQLDLIAEDESIPGR
jgi:hypothetical protein